jgi:hypothetical protein
MKLEEKAAGPLAGGIAQHGYQCGMLWGAALAAGAQAYRQYGPGSQAEAGAIKAAQGQVAYFRARTGNRIDCRDITSIDMMGEIKPLPILKFIVTGGPIGVGACFRLIAAYAPEVAGEISATLDGAPIAAPEGPLSCASLLARKMGASEQHATMVAGFAGGIGLSGGGCGALGAAIWLTILNNGGQSQETIGLNSPETQEVIDRFVEASDYEFECRDIVGRHFDSVDDHAEYVCAGGCARILEALAAAPAA